MANVEVEFFEVEDGQTHKGKPKKQIFFSLYFVYFAFYFTRYNLPVATPIFIFVYGWNASSIGSFFTALSLCYALGQFINGHLVDRQKNLRLFVSIGAFSSVLMNIFIFICLIYLRLESDVFFYLVMISWAFNGYFQSFGWCSVVRAMHMWYPDPRARGKLMGFFSTCFMLGGGASSALAVGLTAITSSPFSYASNWNLVFLVPALVFLGFIVMFFVLYRNHPLSSNRPNHDDDDGKEANHIGLRAALNLPILSSAISYLFITSCRYGVINWLPSYLSLGNAGTSTSTSTVMLAIKIVLNPVSGSIGTIVAGWSSEKIFKGYRIVPIVILLLLNGIVCSILPLISGDSVYVYVAIAAIGFCTYGAVGLISGHCAQDFGGKASGAAAGLIDGFGYIGAAAAGVLLGLVADNFSYTVMWWVCGGLSVMSAVALLPIVNRRT